METLKANQRDPQPVVETQERVTELRLEIQKIQSMYDDMKKELSKNEDQSGTKPKDPVFRAMFKALQKARIILTSIDTILEKSTEALPNIGKRQRTD